MALLDIFFTAQVLFVFVVHSSTCHILDVEYSERVVSDHKDDWFGNSLATSHHKLVIGAPTDDNSRGSVMVDEGVRVKGPEGGKHFGSSVDVNQQFIVVSGEKSSPVYAYQSNSPYEMVTRLPMDGQVWSLVISDDNTIAVSHYDINNKNWLTIYQYDGSSAWNIAKKFELESKFGNPLSVYGDVIVVGAPYASDNQGLVHIFNRVGGVWEKRQTIKRHGIMFFFGMSVSIHGQHMAVSNSWQEVFTYILDYHSNTWIPNGKHSVPGRFPYVSIQNEFLVVTVTDMNRLDV